MSNAIITSASASLGASGVGSIMTVLADEFLAAKRQRGHVLKYCNTEGTLEGESKLFGVVRFMVPPSGSTVSDETDGVTPDAVNTIATSKDVTLNVHKTVVFEFSQIGQTLDGGRSIAPITAGRMADLFNAIENDISGLASTFSTNSVGTAATDLTAAVLDAGRATLINADVPAGDPLYGLLHQSAHAWQAVGALPNFNEYRIRGNQPDAFNPNADYGVTPIYYKNSYWLESQSVKQATISSIVNTYNFLFHKDALLVAMKAPMIPTSPGVEAMNFMDPLSGIEFQILKYWDKDTGSDVLKIHSLYGKTIGRDDWGCILLS
jgi:hypothetical protein